MEVLAFNEQRDLKIEASSIAPIVEYVLNALKRTCDELSIYFVSEEEITELHSDYFDDPTPTDCISFPMDNEEGVGPKILGEVFICPKVAMHYVKESQGPEHSLVDIYRECTLYLLHGLLHLLGYDDIEPEDQAKMYPLQEKLMQQLIESSLLLRGA